MEDFIKIVGGATLVAIAMPFIAVFVVLLSLGLDLILAWPLMWAWNHVIPGMFGLHPVTYWQSFCLLVVATLLVKGSSSSSSGKSS